MRNAISLLVGVLLTAGHVIAEPKASAEVVGEPSITVGRSPRIAMEVPYFVRGYHDTRDPNLRHGAHVVYRRIMVAVRTESGDERVPHARSVAHAPLPMSTELAAELATQKALTAEVQAVEKTLKDIERAMRAHYADLLRQSASVQRVREELEAERERLRVVATESLPSDPPSPESTKSTAAPW